MRILCILGFLVFATSSFSAFYYTNAKWDNGSTINIFFKNGSLAHRRLVARYANVWSQYANLRLNFITNQVFDFDRHKTQADIIVKFIPNGFKVDDPEFLERVENVMKEREISFQNLEARRELIEELRNPPFAGQSHVGRFSKDVAQKGKSTLLIKNLTPFVIIHEFGHALGLAHEHQRPDRPELIYNQDDQWDKFRYGIRTENVTILNDEIDFDSVMHYESAFGRYTKPRTPSPNRNHLSLEDRIGIAKLYPGKITEEEIRGNFSLRTESDRLRNLDYFQLFYLLANPTEIDLSNCQILSSQEMRELNSISLEECPEDHFGAIRYLGYNNHYTLAENQCFSTKGQAYVHILTGSTLCNYHNNIEVLP